MKQKVFCIGFHKTGTSSLAIALTHLGFNVCRRMDMIEGLLPDVDLIDDLRNEEYSNFLSITDQFNAFCDNPWPLFFKKIEQQFPEAKFILTTRDESSWMRSVLQYFNNSSSEIRSMIYGDISPTGNEDLYIQKYRQHNISVLDYFKNKPEKLLVLAIEAGNKWEKLCPFLNVEVPSETYPHENTTPESLSKQKKKLTLKRFQGFFQLSLQKKILFLETFVTIVLARLSIILFSFRSIAKKIGTHQQESTRTIPTDSQLKGNEISKMIKKVSLYTPFRSLCFEQALACKIMLNRRNISSTIYFGLLKEKQIDTTDLKAHAWLRSGNHILTGNKGRKKFKVVSFFGDELPSK